MTSPDEIPTAEVIGVEPVMTELVDDAARGLRSRIGGNRR